MQPNTFRFEGTCDVCGEPISLDYDPNSGVIDYGVLDDGRIYTWIRHYASAPEGADPRCAIYSSAVREVKDVA